MLRTFRHSGPLRPPRLPSRRDEADGEAGQPAASPASPASPRGEPRGESVSEASLSRMTIVKFVKIFDFLFVPRLTQDPELAEWIFLIFNI